MATRKGKSRQPRHQPAARRQKKPGKTTLNGAHPSGNPWDEFIGMFKKDKDFARVKKQIAKHRRQRDADNTLP
jgi:hypothetical protein